MQNKLLKYFLPISLALAVLRSYVGAADEAAWCLQTIPALAGLAALVVTREKIQLTPFIYWLIWVLVITVLIGAHYTAAAVPFFLWLKDSFRWNRDYYDLFEYFIQGAVLAMLIRELMLRQGGMKRDKWLVLVAILGSLGASILVEGLQWGGGMALGAAARPFLTAKGSAFDMQSDMLCVLLGAGLGLKLLTARHDQALRKVWKSKIGPMRWIDVIA